MSQRERALSKLNKELKKDIALAIDKAKQCQTTEILYFFYLLHYIRLLDKVESAEIVSEKMVNIYQNSLTETLKYLISITAKYGLGGEPATHQKHKNSLKNSLIQFLIKHGNYINSKYESTGMLQLFDVTVSGERDQYCEIDISKGISDPTRKGFFDYFVRAEIDNENTCRFDTPESLFDRIKSEYMPFSHFFICEMGVTVEEFCDFIDYLISKVKTACAVVDSKLRLLPNGDIDIEAVDNIYLISQCFLLSKKQIYKEYGNKYRRVLNRLTFSNKEFDANQLRFHHVTRRPLIVQGDMVMVSGELILDSLFINIHYSLLESKTNGVAYREQQASHYLDKLVNIASKYGYHTVAKELDLYDGKNQIGDIDLILKNNVGHYLLIEAKNHAVPLDVYFKDYKKTKAHLHYLQNNWERKVNKRVEHLKSNHLNYDIGQDYDYIIVSRFPEIISHFSELLILSSHEFDLWLNEAQPHHRFEEFFKDTYEKNRPDITIDEIQILSKDNLLFGDNWDDIGDVIEN